MWVVFALLGSVFAALVGITAKLGLKSLDTSVATTIRSIIMSAILVAFVAFTGKYHNVALKEMTSKDWTYIIISGACGALSWLFMFTALKKAPVGPVTSIDRLSIVFTVIIAAIFLGESLTWKVGLGAMLIVAGAILISLK